MRELNVAKAWLYKDLMDNARIAPRAKREGAT
jgi:hypothetical protein